MEKEEKEIELQKIIDDYFVSSDYKIIETILRGERGTKVLEIFVDHLSGININDISQMNKDLSALIDEKIILNDISNLVVSSPGAERPLKFHWQLIKHTGRILEIEMNDSELIEGKLMELSGSDEDNGKIILEIAVKEKGKKNAFIPREIKFSDIKELKVKLSFSKK